MLSQKNTSNSAYAITNVAITGAGNVGIGTAPTALAALKVAGTGILSTTGINVSGNGGFYNAANKFGVDVNGPTSRFYASGPDGTTPGDYEFHIIASDGTPDTIAMRILNNGNVGIGTTTPETNLQLGQVFGFLQDINSGYIDCNLKSSGQYIKSQFATRIHSDSALGEIKFLNAPSGTLNTPATLTERMRIYPSGVIRFNTYTAGTLNTDANGIITAVSDERLKTIDGNFSAGLNEVLQIKPILYHWNKSSQLDTENMYAGFSAQNIQSVIPIAVMAQKDTGYLSIQDRPIIAALVNSIKELEARIKILELK